MEDVILNIIRKKQCWIEYQPIIDSVSGNTMAYEALSRFYDNGRFYAPDEIFNASVVAKHTMKLLEIMAKSLQFKFRPSCMKTIYVNISPQSILTEECMLFWINTFKHIDALVVEVTEVNTEEHSSAVHAFIDLLKKHKINYAIDDLYSERGIFGTRFVAKASIVKIDKEFFWRSKSCYFERCLLSYTIEFCRMHNKMLIVEGVENLSDFTYAEGMGIQYMQGFHFKGMFLSSTSAPVAAYTKEVRIIS